jgi:hypothetical protein
MSIVEPTGPQYEYITSTAPFPAMVAGFGAGKTGAAILRSILGKIQNPTTNRGFYLPTYDLVRTIAFPRFEEALEMMGIAYRLYKSPLNKIVIPHYGEIIFRSMDAPHRIIGYEHADADCDELDTLSAKDAAEVWRRVISRNRQKKPNGSINTIGVTTTPEGFRFVYEAWKSKPRKGHVIIQAPTYSNPHLPDGYIDNMRDQYEPALLEAYVEGEFVNLTSGTVYRAFDRELNNCDDVEKDGERLYVGMDFNVENMAAIINVKRDGKPRSVNEFTGVFDTGAMIKLLKDRYPKNKIVVYPDASGANRQTVNASTNDLALLSKAGFSLVVNLSNPSVKDRVTACNSAFCNANNERNYLVNVKRCPELTKCLEQQAYDKHGKPDKANGDDHPLDAMGYFIVKDYPVLKPLYMPRLRRYG